METPFEELNSAEKTPQHSQIAVTNYRSGRCLSQEFKIHMGLSFSPEGIRFSPRVFVLVHGVLGLRSSFLGLSFRNTPGNDL